MEMWGEGGYRIFRRGSDGSDVYSSWSGEAEFVKLFPILQEPHAAEQSSPCFFA